MLNKFWMWLLGFKDPNAETKKADEKPTSRPSSSSLDDTTAEDEGNFRSGPGGYESGGYEGR